MKVIIVEDEHGAGKNLTAVLQEVIPNVEILALLESVSETVEWIKSNPQPDLGFFDIHLSDNNAFEIFNQCTVNFPVIFTTAYDEYAINAFKVNCIDYILKPVNVSAVKFAFEKFLNLETIKRNITEEKILSILKEIRKRNSKHYKKSFLVTYKDRLLPVRVNKFAYFFIENTIVYGVTRDKKKYIIDQNLDTIESQLDPDLFFRANRQFIVAKSSIKELSLYFNGKLSVKVIPPPPEKIIVSKAKSTSLKKWLAE